MTHNAQRALALTLLLFLILLPLACGRSGAGDAGRTLLIYTPHGQDMLKDFVARYKQAHPEVSVQFLDMGSREVLERVRAERNRPQADLWWGAAHTTFQTAANENLLAPYKPSWSGNVPESSRDAEDRWYGTYETPEVIVYNSEAVSLADAPKDWDDVLDARWRDKVLIRNPNPSDSMRAIFGAMVWRFYGETNSPAGGYDWLRKLDANVHEYTADGTLLMQKMARREGLISLWDMPDVRLYREQKHFPVDYVIPRSGTPVVTDGIAILRGAPHEEEARRFYEFVTTPESLTHAAQSYYRLPVRTDIDRAQLPAWMNQPFTRMPLDWNLLNRDGNEWLRYWDTEIRGRNK
ncbi:MAG: iron(III) transport system substrate-binding protein [Blastocatellia bacterium]|jgi:iron(III) transport system substrate-binding protein|nr:iron(III) transport system substrate-binding protein [Blastocatellia bacterium]